MISLASLVFLVVSAPFAQVLGASVSGYISAPLARTKVGPALVAACGESFAGYLDANPGATSIDLDAKVDSNFRATCISNACGYYKLSDNLDRILTVKPRDIFNITTNITGLPPYPAASDHHAGYTTVSLVNSTRTTELSLTADYAVEQQHFSAGNFWRWNFLYGPDDIPFPIGTCTQGCSISWNIQQTYWELPLIYYQDVYQQCVDFNIDWTGFQP